MLVVRNKTKTEYMQDIINKYIDETNEVEFDLHEVAAWAVRKGLYESSPTNVTKQCAQELARAARNEYYTDPQNRRVRKKHAVRQKQGVLWADIETAPPDHMKLSLQQRRGYIKGGCIQLKTDLDSYNENNVHGVELQMIFDFTEDLHEHAMPEVYPDSKPDNGS